MPLTDARRAEIRRLVQEPFLIHSRGRTTPSTIEPPDYDPDDFEPDERSVDGEDPGIAAKLDKPSLPIIGSTSPVSNRHKARSPRRQVSRKATWCVELKRKFKSMSDAARFVDRSAANISEAIAQGIRCGTYRWEEYDERKHGAAENMVV